MTLVRRFVVGVSGFVVRHASVGSREWAEGLAREVEVVEGDWTALGWALGSLWVLVDRREAPILSLEEVPKAAQRLVENARMGSGALFIVFQGPLYLWKLYGAKNWSQRAGCAAVVFGSILAGTNWLIVRRRLKEPYTDDVYDDVVACAGFYRAELERLLPRQWILTFALSCYCVGVVASYDGGVWFHSVFAVSMALLYIATVPLVMHARRMNQRRIERFDELLDAVSGR